MVKLLFGGSFDPIHYGHLAVIDALHELLPTVQIIVMPCKQSPLKTQAATAGHIRLAMLQLALNNRPYVTIDPLELSNGQEMSYTYETLCNFPNIRILTVGSDAFSELHHWYRWQDILAAANIIVISRQAATAVTNPHVNVSPITDPHTLLQLPYGKIYHLITKTPDISSSQIRSCIKKQQAIEQFVPPQIAQYIRDNHLYTD